MKDTLVHSRKETMSWPSPSPGTGLHPSFYLSFFCLFPFLHANFHFMRLVGTRLGFLVASGASLTTNQVGIKLREFYLRISYSVLCTQIKSNKKQSYFVSIRQFRSVPVHAPTSHVHSPLFSFSTPTFVVTRGGAQPEINALWSLSSLLFHSSSNSVCNPATIILRCVLFLSTRIRRTITSLVDVRRPCCRYSRSRTGTAVHCWRGLFPFSFSTVSSSPALVSCTMGPVAMDDTSLWAIVWVIVYAWHVNSDSSGPRPRTRTADQESPP